MSRSINNRNTDWKREWEEEMTLTPEEQKEADALRREEEALNAMILQDLRMLELEREKEEYEEWQIEQRLLHEAEDQRLYQDYDYPLG